jgi:hypothetical protein
MPIEKSDSDLPARIGKVLHYIWDPVGVRGAINARDEYDAYIPGVCSLMEGGSTAETIATHLVEIATQRMGPTSTMEHCRTTAEKLLGWRAMGVAKASGDLRIASKPGKQKAGGCHRLVRA